MRGGHDKSDDETDFDQTQDSPQVEGHEWIIHSDDEIDQDEGY